MEIGVLMLPPLGDDVSLDLTFAPVTADRADVVPVRPALAAPEVLLHRGDSAEHLAGGQALDHPHDLRRAIRGDRLYEEVRVVPVCPNLEEDDFIPFDDLQANVPQHRIHLGREDGSPILRWTREVVQQDGDIVAAVDVLTHTPSLSQPDATSRGE